MFLLRSLSVLCFVFLSVAVSAQSRTSLEKKKSDLKKDIAYTNKLLEENSQNKKNSLNRLVLLDRKLEERKELLYTLGKEVKLISSQIEEIETNLASMEDELVEIKEEYAEMIRHAWKTRNDHDKIMFVFGAESFNQAYKRIRYLQQYSDYRKKQVDNIARIEARMKSDLEELAVQQKEHEEVLASQKAEQTKLASEKSEIEGIYEDLQSEEEELKKKIAEKEKEQNSLQRAIERIIEAELKTAAANSSATVGTAWKLTPEAAALANEFTANKGQLPWPVEKGVITMGYGLRQHPVLKRLKVMNNGVTISTSEGGVARAVFAGEVSSVIIIQGAGKAVIVRHGDYMTVYGNLSDVFVAKGDKISTKQKIGLIKTDMGSTELQFELRKGKEAETLDPAYWLYQAR